MPFQFSFSSNFSIRVIGCILTYWFGEYLRGVLNTIVVIIVGNYMSLYNRTKFSYLICQRIEALF
jgi:hypothetical protein